MRDYKNKNIFGCTGYTLLEILIVLTLLAGVSFFLILKIPSDIQEKNIEISATKLLEDLRETQQAAIAASSWYTIKFYPSTGEYKIFKEAEHIRTVKLHQGVYFGNSPSEITILPSGVPNLGFTVILKYGKYERHIVMAPVMGRIRMEIVR